MEKLKYYFIYQYEFYRGTRTVETAGRVNNVYDADIAKENIVRFWFQNFRFGNFELHNNPRGRPVTKVDDEEIIAIVIHHRPLQS